MLLYYIIWQLSPRPPFVSWDSARVTCSLLRLFARLRHRYSILLLLSKGLSKICTVHQDICETDFQKGRELTQALRRLAKLSLRCQMLAYLKVYNHTARHVMFIVCPRKWIVNYLRTDQSHGIRRSSIPRRNNSFSSVWSANGVVIGIGLFTFGLSRNKRRKEKDEKVYNFNFILLHVCLLGFRCLDKCPFKCFWYSCVWDI